MSGLFDLHCDTALGIYQTSESLKKNNGDVDLERFSVFDKKAQVFAIWSPQTMTEDECFVNFKNCYEYFKNQLEQHSDEICLCTSKEDLQKGFESKKLCGILGVEDVRLLGGDLDRLHVLHECGVRVVTLGWQGETSVCGGFDTETGLTPFGYEVLKECEGLGITVDVSHLSERSFWDVAGKATKPFIASHSCSFAVQGHKRNLTDMQYRTIASFNGIVGVNLVGAHLSDELLKEDTTSTAVYEAFYRHTEHFLEMSESTLGLGLDFDGSSPLPGVEDISCIPNLYEALYNKGIDSDTIERVGFDNAYRFFEENLK